MSDFEFHVTSLARAEKMMQEGWPSHIITVLGSKDVIPSSGSNHLVVEVDDTEIEDPSGKWVAITREDIDRVLAFSKDIPDNACLLVHCLAGKSRSTAVLLGVLVQHGMTPEEALEALLSIRPVAIPNRRIIDLLDAALEQKGALVKVVEDYYKRLMIPGLHLPDRGGANL